MINSIGTIGAGKVGQAVALRAIRAGVSVVLSNSRGPQSLDAVVAELGEGALAGTLAEAMECDAVVLAVPFVDVPDVGRAIGDSSGKIVIDATNHFAQSHPAGGRVPLGGLTASEWVQDQLPGATIVKAFNSMYVKFISAEPCHEEGLQTVFVASDDESAKSAVISLVDAMGFAGIDLGSLADGGRLMQLDGLLSVKHFLFQA